VWKRNLLFIALAIFALGSLAASLIPANRVDNPINFDEGRDTRGEFAATLATLNDEFRQHWVDSELESAPRAHDLAIARRLSLALTGTIPSLEEIKAFEKQKPEHRVEWWVSRLLEDKRYADYVAERLARTYVGVENGQFLIFRRRRFVHWLSERLHENMAYDELVRRLLTDEGLWTDTPSVNFVTVTVDDNDEGQPDPISLAGRTTRAFLGMRIDCVQCHDDNLGNINFGTPEDPSGGMQEDFHQLAAFFAETRTAGGGVRDIGEEPYKYTYLDEETEESVPAMAPYSSHLLPTEGKPRERLAAWVTHPENKPFARAMVNRVWALMFGRALNEPIDDIPLYAEFAEDEKYPAGLETLADDFIKHKFDLQRLIRIIAASDVFQRDSRASFQITYEHESHWAVFPLTRLRPEQVAGSLIQSTSLTTIDANAHVVSQLVRFIQQNDFVQRYGDTGEDEFEDRGGTIPQRLIMMNGNLQNERTNPGGLLMNAIAQIAILSPSNEKAIETAYLSVFTRRPSDAEMTHMLKSLTASGGGDERTAQIKDIYWLMMNTTEFAWNH